MVSQNGFFPQKIDFKRNQLIGSMSETLKLTTGQFFQLLHII